MNRVILSLSFRFLITALVCGPVILVASNKSETLLKQKNSRAGFIENKGQIIDQNNNPNPAVLYLLNTPGMNVQLRRDGFSYDLYSLGSLQSAVCSRKSPINRQDSIINYPLSIVSYHRLDITLPGSNPSCQLIPSDPLPDYFNYFTSNCPPEGIKNVRQYSKVTYENIYPGIDLEFLTDETHGYKYNFLIHPGADINDIRLRIEGPEYISLIRDTLKFGTRFGEIEELIPESYYLFNDSKVEIWAWFKKITNEVYGFSVDKTIPSNSLLVIDPTPKRLWGTDYGGAKSDLAGQCSTDKAGNVFLYGATNSLDNIASAGSFKDTISGFTDCFLVKFDAAGQRQWGTYFGGTKVEQADNNGTSAIAVDKSGNIYFTGLTSSFSGIVTPGAHQTVYGGGNNDCFLEKFNQAGYRIWGTYYGGAAQDDEGGVTTDKYGNVFLAGDSHSQTGIATAGSYQPNLFNTSMDAFLAKFDSNGVRQWGTYYGGEMEDFASSCTTDGLGNVYFTGNTSSQTNIASPGAFQTIFGGESANYHGDAFLAKFTTGGQRIWATYYGGENGDGGSGCIADSIGNICMVGSTTSLSGIASPGCHQPVFGGSFDGFVVKFDSSGQRLWGTYYGGKYFDETYGCAFGWNGDIFVVGETGSGNNISTPDAYQTTLEGLDGFLVKFNAAGQRYWGTYYGGSGTGEEVFDDCSYIKDDTIYAAGVTSSTDNIASPGAWQQAYGGGPNDCMLIKFLDCWPIIAGPITGPDTLCIPSTAVNYSIPPLVHSLNFTWTLPPGFTITSGAGTPGITVDISNSAVSGTIWVKGMNKCGDPGDSASLFITLIPTPVPVISGPDIACTGTSNVYTTAPGKTNYQWTVSAGGVISAGGTATDNSVTVTWNTAGTQHVGLNYTVTGGCDALAPTDYSVQVTSTPVALNVTVSASQNPVCLGDSVTLTAVPSNVGSVTVYQWFVNGSAAGTDTSVYSYVPVNGDQVICILTSDLQCIINNTALDTVLINVTDTHKVTDTTLCYGTPYFAQGAWQTTAGIYHDTLANPASCIRYIETNLNYKPLIAVDLGKDTVVCGNPMILRVHVPGGNCSWQDGSTDSTYVVTLPGEYSVVVHYDGCVNSDTVNIGECPPSGPVWFPDAFTPNGDGLNDTFRPVGTGIEKFSMQIFDRWGTMVFETSSPGTGWDGTFKGSLCPEETYVFKAAYKMTGGEEKQVTGTVILQRGIR